MPRKVIQWDMDGVLVDFSKGFTTLANKLFGTKIVSDETQLDWNFRFELTPEQRNQVWFELQATDRWWTDLEPLVDASIRNRIQNLSLEYDCYFVTNRFSERTPPGIQTVHWLNEHGIPNARVILSKYKGEMARLLGVTHSLEDNWDNAGYIYCIADSPQVKSYLLNRPYNQALRGQVPEKLIRLNSVSEFLDICERDPWA